jgi:FlaA1/EpsC-like NDP-sugar epimerase
MDRTSPTTRPTAESARSMRASLSALPRSVKRLLMISFDTIALPAALFTALSLRFGESRFSTTEIILMLVLAPLIAVPIFIKLDLYRAVIRYLEMRMALTVVAAVSVAASLLLLVLVMFGVSPFTVADAVVYWSVALVYVGASRIAAREFFARQSARTSREPTIIYGAGDAGAQLAISLKNKGLLVPVAFVDDNADIAGSFLYGIRVYPASELSSLVRLFGVRQVLLAMPSASKDQRRKVLNTVEPLGIKTRTIPRLADLIEGRARISDIQDVTIEEVMGRDPVPPIPEMLAKCIAGKIVLVTGAGGSIGSELSRQIISHGARKLILLELSEFALYRISEELAQLKQRHGYTSEIVSVLGSVARTKLVDSVLAHHGVDTIYHAAAYKHVPLLESNPLEGIRNNVIGTWRIAKSAIEHRVSTFVLISTDKAVRPANIMGASKRLAEMLVQAIGVGTTTRFCMVRFGNVLGSSGSVVPLFRKQIQAGGPVSVTHPEITRYFMTIPEAAQLVLQASSMAAGGDVFVLDMGEPVKILDLARSMIQLSGLTVRSEANPRGDIEIRYIGLRPGEKLYEELLIGKNASGSEHPLIMRAIEESPSWEHLHQLLGALQNECSRGDEASAIALLTSVVPIGGHSERRGAATRQTASDTDGGSSRARLAVVSLARRPTPAK